MAFELRVRSAEPRGARSNAVLLGPDLEARAQKTSGIPFRSCLVSLSSAIHLGYSPVDGTLLRYDSVTVQGQLAWQCRLNSLNLPWLLSADSMFLDYHVSLL